MQKQIKNDEMIKKKNGNTLIHIFKEEIIG